MCNTTNEKLVVEKTSSINACFFVCLFGSRMFTILLSTVVTDTTNETSTEPLIQQHQSNFWRLYVLISAKFNIIYIWSSA